MQLKNKNMGEDTLFNLRWDAQRQAILCSVSEIFREESFVDITIVSDGQIFKAHRLILAASSPYLKQALLTVPSEHAVLLLPQVSSNDLANILKFIYEGEIKMNQKALKSFLQVSKLLKIKGMDFDPDEDITTEIPISSKRNSPDIEDQPLKRVKLNNNNNHHQSSTSSSSSPSLLSTTTPTITTPIIPTTNNNNTIIDNHERDHEHIPSSTADFQIHGYDGGGREGGRGGNGDNPSTSSSCDRDREEENEHEHEHEHEHDESDIKSEHLDYDKELISLDEEDDDDLGGEDYDGEDINDDDDEQGDGFPFQPEVSFEEGTWGIPHSSTSSSSLLQQQQQQQQQQQSSSHNSSSSSHVVVGGGRRPILNKRIVSSGGGGGGTTTTTQSFSEGILQRMMREPLKSSTTASHHYQHHQQQQSQSPSSMSISMTQGHTIGHSLSTYVLHDNPGLRKTTKRYVQCTSCSKVLSSLSALKRHMEDVHCARIQGKCIICGRVYSSRNSLLTHVYSAHKKHHDYKAVARIIRESDFEQFTNV